MPRHFSRLSTLPVFPILLLLSSASTQTFGAQSTTVPLPPSAKLPPTKVDRPGFPAIPKFKDIAQAAGLTVSHISSGEKRYIIESMSGGTRTSACAHTAPPDMRL